MADTFSVPYTATNLHPMRTCIGQVEHSGDHPEWKNSPDATENVRKSERCSQRTGEGTELWSSQMGAVGADEAYHPDRQNSKRGDRAEQERLRGSARRRLDSNVDAPRNWNDQKAGEHHPQQTGANEEQQSAGEVPRLPTDDEGPPQEHRSERGHQREKKMSFNPLHL